MTIFFDQTTIDISDQLEAELNAKPFGNRVANLRS